MTVQDLAQYQDKKVIVVHKVEGKNEAVETEGTAQAANETGVLLKPKGKTQLLLLDAGSIDDIRFVDEKPKEIKRKMLKPVEFGQARTHLLERHGYYLAAVNALSEKQAFEQHKGIDHEGQDLGHYHGVKESKPESDSDA